MNQHDVKRGLELCEKATEGYSVLWMQHDHADLEAYPDDSFEPVHIASFDWMTGYDDLNFCAQSRTLLPDSLKMVDAMAERLQGWCLFCEDHQGCGCDGSMTRWDCCQNKDCPTGQILREYFKEAQDGEKS